MDFERIIVTGGAGFIGSNFVKTMVEKNPQIGVTIMDKLTYAGNLENLNGVLGKSNVDFSQLDICDPKVRDIIRSGDLIVNFAAESHVDNSNQNSDPFYRTNVQGTRNLLNSAIEKKAGLFIQISTDEVYGELKQGDPQSREGDFGPGSKMLATSPYSKSKAQAELVCFDLMDKMPIIITRSSNNYGPFQHTEKFIPRALTNLLVGKNIPLYGSGKYTRDWIHVSDNCNGIERVISAGVPGEVYNIGGENQTENLELAKKLIGIMGLQLNRIEFTADRKNHDKRYDIDVTKIKNLGWKPTYDFEKGLEQTVNWYKNNSSWWEAQKVETEKRYFEQTSKK